MKRLNQMKNIKTTSSLLLAAAANILDSTDKTSGLHKDCETAIVSAASLRKYRKEVVQRALREFRVMFGNDRGEPKSGRKLGKEPVFGKLFSETRDKYALKNVLKNRDARVTALTEAASRTDCNPRDWPSKSV